MSLDLLERIQQGDRRALARGITYLENNGANGKTLLDHMKYNHASSQVIGITGPPGSGKSTLVDQLIKHFRKQELTVAVVAVDPTSPFTGGAILGDRIRMLNRTSDSGVYIRSIASRGQLGGLSPHTFDVIRLIQHAGFDKIIVETVGAGQSEIDIVRNSDTTIVLSVPGLGDDIQMIKAGIMEIADLFVINKSDLSGSEGLKIQIKNMLELIPHNSDWVPKIIETSALNDEGVNSLVDTINQHMVFLSSDSRLEERRENQLQFDLTNKLNHRINQELLKIDPDPISMLVDQLVNDITTLSEGIEGVIQSLVSTLSND